MFCDLPNIVGIWRIRVIILVDNRDTRGNSSGITSDIEEDCDMLLVPSRKGIVRLPIETGDHESLVR